MAWVRGDHNSVHVVDTILQLILFEHDIVHDNISHWLLCSHNVCTNHAIQSARYKIIVLVRICVAVVVTDGRKVDLINICVCACGWGVGGGGGG